MSNATSEVVAPRPSRPIGLSELVWDGASVEQQEVLSRIHRQRQRLQARTAAKKQAKELMQTRGEERVLADAPLPERLLTFVRLHPVATAAAGAVIAVLGPRKLIRWGSVVLPWILKFQQRG